MGYNENLQIQFEAEFRKYWPEIMKLNGAELLKRLKIVMNKPAIKRFAKLAKMSLKLNGQPVKGYRNS